MTPLTREKLLHGLELWGPYHLGDGLDDNAMDWIAWCDAHGGEAIALALSALRFLEPRAAATEPTPSEDVTRRALADEGAAPIPAPRPPREISLPRALADAVDARGPITLAEAMAALAELERTGVVIRGESPKGETVWVPAPEQDETTRVRAKLAPAEPDAPPEPARPPIIPGAAEGESSEDRTGFASDGENPAENIPGNIPKPAPADLAALEFVASPAGPTRRYVIRPGSLTDRVRLLLAAREVASYEEIVRELRDQNVGSSLCTLWKNRFVERTPGTQMRGSFWRTAKRGTAAAEAPEQAVAAPSASPAARAWNQQYRRPAPARPVEKPKVTLPPAPAWMSKPLKPLHTGGAKG